MSLQLVISNSLLILGVHVLFWPGMFLSFMTPYLMHLPRVVRKPLYECLICMSSIWGTAFFLYKNGLSLGLIPLLPHLLAVCGCNVILDSCIHYWRRGGNRQNETIPSEVPSFEAPDVKGKLN